MKHARVNNSSDFRLSIRLIPPVYQPSFTLLLRQYFMQITGLTVDSDDNSLDNWQ